ncbi:MAG: AAA family ATPase [Bacilli bacterium]|nr:AAA family ATPase [Bacilli bacterium]
MYLKEIITHGFKSFADKIEIDLDKGITGIVGPNGSGKSNVVDAVRWVLGEQSIKSLRGSDNMSDVIFSGSKSRNPLNVASVALVFDNSDHYLPLDFNEVSIKRRVYRDGTNEYFINNEKCRLKDVTDLLLDTGIAKESFNIISQGKIDEILSNKPQDRRVVFEEAAGVLKYKKRKEEALRKLDKTHDNMDRVEDIIGELEKQVTPLKEQKEKALEYLDVKENLEQIEVALLATDITNINEEYKNKKALIEKLNTELLSLNTSSSGSEAKITELKAKIDVLNSSLSTTILDEDAPSIVDITSE